MGALEVGAPGPTHCPPPPVISSAAAGTCAPGSTAVPSHHLTGGRGSASRLPSPCRLRAWMVTGRNPAPPPAPPPPLAAPLLGFLPLALCWGRAGSWRACGGIGWRSPGEQERSASGRRSGLGRRGDCAHAGRWLEGGSLPCTHWAGNSLVH